MNSEGSLAPVGPPAPTNDRQVRNVPVDVKGVNIIGNEKTRSEYFNNEFREALACRDLHSLHGQLNLACERLRATGVFKSADIDIRVEEGGKNGAIAAVVNVQVKEKRTPYLQVSMNTSVNSSNSSVGSGDSVGCEVQGVMPNLVGLAESYRCAVRTDNWGEKDLHAGISIPSITSHQLPVSLNARMFQDDRSNVNSSRTKCISFSLGVMSKNLRHKLTTDFSVRDEAVTTGVSTVPVVGQVKDASKEVMSLVAPSSKSSIMYSYTNDTRNNGPSPTRGNLVETVVEAALPPGTAQFFRSGVSLQMHREILSPMRVLYSKEEGKASVFTHAPGLSISLCSSAAAIVPLNVEALLGSADKSAQNILLSDRLYSGNHLFSRGFAPNTIGPRSVKGSGGCPGGDVLGGQLRYNALAAISAPVPVDTLAKHGARAFGFCSAAAILTPSAWKNKDLIDILSGKSYSNSLSGNKNLLEEAIGSARVSVGCGLSLPIGPARLELTYSVPVLKTSSDSVRQFQVGLGVSIS